LPDKSTGRHRPAWLLSERKLDDRLQQGAGACGAASAEVKGVVIPFIGLDELIATKRTGRLQDAADIEVLEEIKRELERPLPKR
jgi:hypothetical protein